METAVMRSERLSRVTIVDVARRAEVSKSTVSLVITGSPLVSAKTRCRVQAIADELGYVYNRGAANLRTARSDIVGMVINDLTNPFFAELAVGIESALQGSNFIPIMANTGESLVRQAQVFRTMRERNVAGIVLCPAGGTDHAALVEIAAAGIPVVLAMRRVMGADVSAVVPNNYDGAMRAVEHLARLGHRRIAFLGGFAGMSAFVERFGGFRKALEQCGLSCPSDYKIEAPTTKAGGIAAMNRALSLLPAPTAALCFNDVVAIGAIHALNRRGLQVGADCAIVGFDNILEAADVGLTTIALDAEALGERAAHLLLEQIETGSPRVEHYVGEALLIVRQSCGSSRRIKK
jgi:LacI family transcriptional regulator, galactose operon repressor